MRFHSLVLSILNGIPAIPIAYGHKTLALAKKCGLSDYTLVWNTFQDGYFGRMVDVSSEEILEKLEKLCRDIDAVQKKIKTSREVLCESANRSFLQLEKTLQ